MKLYHAHIYPMDREPIENGWVSIQDGKITELGQGEIVPSPEDRDLAGGMLLPGFVDAHTHLGIIENGIGFEGDDCNEASDPFTPQLRAIDGINPRDPSLAHARKAGVTCVCTGPGSANVLGGTFLAMKTVGERVDNMIVRIHRLGNSRMNEQLAGNRSLDVCALHFPHRQTDLSSLIRITSGTGATAYQSVGQFNSGNGENNFFLFSQQFQAVSPFVQGEHDLSGIGGRKSPKCQSRKIGAAIRFLCTDQSHGIGGSISRCIADIDFVHCGNLLI